MAKYFTFGESLVFLQFLPGKPSSKITKEFLHSFSNFLQQLLHSSQTVFLLLKEDMLPTMIQLLIAFKEDFDLIFFFLQNFDFFLYFNYVPRLVGCLDGFKEEM